MKKKMKRIIDWFKSRGKDPSAEEQNEILEQLSEIIEEEKDNNKCCKR